MSRCRRWRKARRRCTGHEFWACGKCPRVIVSKCVHIHRNVLTFAVVSTVAGGVVGSTAVDATGSFAAFFSPWRAAVDSSGNIIVAGQDNRIRQVTPAGVVTTLAGGGVGSLVDGVGTQARFLQPLGVAFDARSGKIIVADTSGLCLRMLSPTNGIFVDAKGSLQPLRWLFMTRIVHCYVLWRVISGHNVCWEIWRGHICGWNRNQRWLLASI
jgi:hypothetical protein